MEGLGTILWGDFGMGGLDPESEVVQLEDLASRFLWEGDIFCWRLGQLGDRS